MALRDRRSDPLSYLEAGSGNVPVLLIHGNFAGKLWWRELLNKPLPQTRLVARTSPDSAKALADVPSHPQFPPTPEPSPVFWIL